MIGDILIFFIPWNITESKILLRNWEKAFMVFIAEPLELTFSLFRVKKRPIRHYR